MDLPVQEEKALVLTVTRKHATVFFDGSILEARVSTKIRDLAAGDLVGFRRDSAGVLVDHRDMRRNVLSRSYQGKAKVLAANLDKLLIVSAPPPLFQTEFIDRVLVAAHVGDISVSLVLNKRDMSFQPVLEDIEVYKKLGIPVTYTCALSSSGLGDVFDLLKQSSMKVAALCGVSGVGKSTILNQLVPQADRRTADVNLKGQGRQTTTQAVAYPCCSGRKDPVFIVDLPGVQHFGLTALAKREAADAFPEIGAAAVSCRYDDCWHTAEPECAVKDAVQGGGIAEFRYLSYCKILAEIDDARPY